MSVNTTPRVASNITFQFLETSYAIPETESNRFCSRISGKTYGNPLKITSQSEAVMTVNTSPRVAHAFANIKFDYLENSCIATDIEKAIGFLEGLMLFNDKTTLIFKNVVSSRSTVSFGNDGTCKHDLGIWHAPGPFSSEQMLNMMQYDRTISNEDWLKHVTLFETKKNTL